jgi:CRP-like cAMP-binding protein
MPPLADFLKSIPYFGSLSGAEIERIARETLERSFDRGEVLFLEGEPALGLYVVKTGRVRIFKSSPEGREQVLITAGAGTTFNEVPVFDGGTNPASASALEAATVYIIPEATMLSLLAGCPAARTIIKLFAARLRHLTGVVEDLSFRSVVSRLARLLLDMAVAQEGPTPVPRLTQEEMATMVGSVRDVVGRALRTLEKIGAIKLEGQRLLVIDTEKLRMAG